MHCSDSEMRMWIPYGIASAKGLLGGSGPAGQPAIEKPKEAIRVVPRTMEMTVMKSLLSWVAGMRGATAP